MRGRAVSIVAVASISVIAFYGTKHVVASPEPVTPFTATVTESRFRSDGTLGRVEESTVAFRSDGSFVRSTFRTLPNQEVVEIKEVVDTKNRKRTIVDYATHSTTTYLLQSIDINHFSVAATVCNSAEGEHGTIAGYDVVLRHEGHTYNNGATKVADRWRAPALNCFPLREVLAPPSMPGARTPHNERAVTKITLGEPDDSIFIIPGDFIERSPSKRQAEFQRLYGISMPPDSAADSAYAAARAHQ